MARAKAQMRSAQNIALVGLFVVAAMTFFIGLGSHPFLDYDEAIYARVIHDTAASGDVVSLSRAGLPFFEKPPLYFWSGMALDTALHSPEWAYRLPAALAGLACFVLVLALVLEVGGSGVAAIMAGIVLLTTGAFVEASREVRLDIPVSACILLATYCFVRGQRDTRWFAGIGVAIALGIMFKIVVALLAGVYMLCWSAVYRDLKWLKAAPLWLGALAGLLILAPWHIYETMRFGAAFWDGYFWHNVVSRVGNDLLGGSLSITDFGKYLLVFTAPWCVALLAIVGRQALAGHPSKWGEAEKAMAAFAATAVLIVTVFAASSTRIFFYLLPAYPFMAIAIGLAAEEMRTRVSRVGFFAVAAVLLGIGVWATNGVVGNQFAATAINAAIASDEAKAGRILAANPEPVKVLTYQWPYWDTLGYYSGGRPIGAIGDGQVVQESYYLIVHSEGNYSYPPSYKARLKTMYQGPALTMYKFTY